MRKKPKSKYRALTPAQEVLRNHLVNGTAVRSTLAVVGQDQYAISKFRLFLLDEVPRKRRTFAKLGPAEMILLTQHLLPMLYEKGRERGDVMSRLKAADQICRLLGLYETAKSQKKVKGDRGEGMAVIMDIPRPDRGKLSELAMARINVLPHDLR